MVEVTNTGEGRALAVEGNGINVISDAERKGRPADLFWPWFGANVSVLGLSYGAFTLGFGISFWQAVIAGVIGIVFSFLLCGVVALAGKRGSAPTMVLSRAAFGVRGNKLPTAISWLLTVGWETALTILATLATATVFDRLGWGGGTATKVVALLVVAALVVGAGVLGFTVIMRLQTVITIVTGVLTVVFVVLAAGQVDWATVSALPSGSVEQVIGALVFLMTGFGLGWVNVAADYSRYLPRTASSRGRRRLDDVRGLDRPGRAAGLRPAARRLVDRPVRPRSARTRSARSPRTLPTWFLVPFALVAVLGLVGGAVLDIYSSGLALLTLGLRIPRWSAALRRRRDHGARHDLRRLLRRRLPRPVPGLPLHPRRAGRRVGRGRAGRRRAAPPRLRRARALRPARAATATSGGRPWRWSSSARCSGGAWSPTPTPRC